MKGLLNKVAVITGAGAGIGKATAICLAERGVTVLLAEKDELTGKAVEQLLTNKGYKAKFYQTDISKESSIAETFLLIKNDFNSLNILINNAATFIMKGIDASVEDWQNSFNTNILGYVLTTKYALDLIKLNPTGGSIVNLCSISGLIAQPKFMTYNTCKGAIESLTRCMALDFAQYNIRVNCISPGTVWTESNEIFTLKHKGLNRAEADNHPKMGGAHILNRVADPSEIGEAIAFLASESSSFMTGSNLIVDGGYTSV